MALTTSRAQIAKIWALAHELGLDREMLYLLVPRGSITALTRREASDLIEQLSGLHARREGAPPLAPGPAAGTPAHDRNAPDATPEQLHFIHFLIGRLGWAARPDRARGFLMKFAGVPTVEQIRDKRRASAIIEALKAIEHRRHAGAQGELFAPPGPSVARGEPSR
jgi:hypothetical protein